MMLWLDAQLPPALAHWLGDELGLNAKSLKELGLRDATDIAIFMAARSEGAVLISKDSDFVDLVQQLGAPPQVVWLTCGNVTNVRLRIVFAQGWSAVSGLLHAGEAVVELGD